MSQSALASQIQSTAGAVAVVNEKGEMSMQKVKVFRYISGRRPKYAPEETSDEESEGEFPFTEKAAVPEETDLNDGSYKSDPRLRRLEKREIEFPEAGGDNQENRAERQRPTHEAEVIAFSESSESEAEDVKKWIHDAEEESSEDEDLDENEIERRRLMIRMKAMEKEEEEELLDHEDDENKSEAASEESEYEEESDSEDEAEQRLKPVFIRKRDRATVKDTEEEARKEKELLQLAKRQAEERKRETLKMIEDDARRELMEQQDVNKQIDLINTDDENDEAAYELWKVRELRRIKRDKDLRESYDKERLEIERIHNMTEEERRAQERANPRVVTNKPAKGKYKFLQKYYHRGAFFMNEEDNVYKRDFSAPTLEDHFDKTVLPKVMQVKNFGRSGRTKYTHLVDQDTTLFDSPWMAESAQNIKFHHNQAGGMKQSFDRPSARKRKK